MPLTALNAPNIHYQLTIDGDKQWNYLKRPS